MTSLAFEGASHAPLRRRPNLGLSSTDFAINRSMAYAMWQECTAVHGAQPTGVFRRETCVWRDETHTHRATSCEFRKVSCSSCWFERRDHKTVLCACAEATQTVRTTARHDASKSLLLSGLESG